MAVVQLCLTRDTASSARRLFCSRRSWETNKPENRKTIHGSKQFPVSSVWLELILTKRTSLCCCVYYLTNSRPGRCSLYWCGTSPQAGTDCLRKCRNETVIAIKTEVKARRDAGDMEVQGGMLVFVYGDVGDAYYFLKYLFLSKHLLALWFSLANSDSGSADRGVIWNRSQTERVFPSIFISKFPPFLCGFSLGSQVSSHQLNMHVKVDWRL